MMSSLKYVLLITSLAYVRIATGIQIVYAAKVNRFIYYDYYFTCSSEGSAQIWRVNQESLGSFTISNRAGSLLKSSRDNFTYIATLASLTPRMQDKYEFRSVMIVTTQRELNLEATCLTESMEDSVNNGNASFSSLRTMKNSVSAEHIALAAMDSNETVISNILLCGVNGSFLDWQVGGRNYRFDSNSQVGATFHIIKNGTFEEQAILIAKEPYQFVSVLFITVPIDFEVYCISSEGNFQFFVTNESITTTFSFPTIAMSSYRINDSNLRTPEEEGILQNTKNVILLICFVGGVPSLCFLAAIIVIIFLSVNISKRKRRDQLKATFSSFKMEVKNSASTVIKKVEQGRTNLAVR